MAFPDFGRSDNPISNRGSRLCPSNYNGTLGFPDLPTALQHHDGFHTQANQGLGKRLRFSNWRDMYHNKSFLFLLMLTTTVGCCCFSGNKLKLLSHFEFASFLRMKSPLDLQVTLKLKNLWIKNFWLQGLIPLTSWLEITILIFQSRLFRNVAHDDNLINNKNISAQCYLFK